MASVILEIQVDGLENAALDAVQSHVAKALESYAAFDLKSATVEEVDRDFDEDEGD